MAAAGPSQGGMRHTGAKAEGLPVNTHPVPNCRKPASHLQSAMAVRGKPAARRAISVRLPRSTGCRVLS
jgi:hypothetical protein